MQKRGATLKDRFTFELINCEKPPGNLSTHFLVLISCLATRRLEPSEFIGHAVLPKPPVLSHPTRGGGWSEGTETGLKKCNGAIRLTPGLEGWVCVCVGGFLYEVASGGGPQ